MEEVDPLTKERLREWQVRRLAIKDQMQEHPEKTLELSRVLDLMDDEHEQILHEARRRGATSSEQQPASHGVNLQLNASAATTQDLRKLLELALHELDGLLEHPDQSGSRGMAGTLGEYRFELRSMPSPSHP